MVPYKRHEYTYKLILDLQKLGSSKEQSWITMPLKKLSKMRNQILKCLKLWGSLSIRIRSTLKKLYDSILRTFRYMKAIKTWKYCKYSDYLQDGEGYELNLNIFIQISSIVPLYLLLYLEVCETSRSNDKLGN